MAKCIPRPKSLKLAYEYIFTCFILIQLALSKFSNFSIVYGPFIDRQSPNLHKLLSYDKSQLECEGQLSL